jgi:hypothetical protein
LSAQPPNNKAPHTNARVRSNFIEGKLALRGFRKVAREVFASLGLGFDLGGIRGRRRSGRAASTAGQENRRTQDEGQLHSSLRATKSATLGLIFHETRLH